MSQVEEPLPFHPECLPELKYLLVFAGRPLPANKNYFPLKIQLVRIFCSTDGRGATKSTEEKSKKVKLRELQIID